MSLSKLSEHQIRSAYGSLRELSRLIEGGGSTGRFTEAANRFFTLIPHNFSTRGQPLLHTEEEVNGKIEMLNTLLKIKWAYNFLKTNSVPDMNVFDNIYEQLNIDVEVLEKTSDEFLMLAKYFKNSHGTEHILNELELEEIFKVRRNGEDARYEPFKKLHNRRLLWHGTMLANYASILSDGLKIAPPEALATGSTYGRGIYFADMVTKAANYCTLSVNHMGLILLCEVALGDMQDVDGLNVVNVPEVKDSLRVRGRYFPDPVQSFFRPDGVEVPLGPVRGDLEVATGTLHNEYVFIVERKLRSLSVDSLAQLRKFEVVTIQSESLKKDSDLLNLLC
ncbi:poly [ADP-ribose] polymerase-like [Lutzomyia longipalpis]|uniref:poly [ADP-ribose] polymerase-like n=1 Tax=Lutzomyia longipalpis TaxID=7200 RepID=UPI002483B521|nr:poly [ADP-ribose] polymerase-like [Lutzomyia longipalpis]